MKLDADWTDDCSGKKDYDAEILSMSTCYWPAEGSLLFFDSSEPEKGLRAGSGGGSCTATCSILLRGDGRYLRLSKKEFSEVSFPEVKIRVEEWAQSQMEIAELALRAAFAQTIELDTEPLV